MATILGVRAHPHNPPTASSLQLAAIGGDRRHRPAGRIDQPIRVCLTAGLLQRPGRGKQQPCQVPQPLPLSITTTDHNPACPGRPPGLGRHAGEFSQQVKVGKTLYSVPWKLIGTTLDARSTPTMVQLFAAGELVKTHARKAAGKQTDLSDYPPEKIAFHMRTPGWCCRQAAGIGPACEELIAALLEDNALYKLRAAQGVIGLADKHQPGRLEAACAKATAAGDPSYRTVKGILAAGTEHEPAAAPAGDGGAASSSPTSPCASSPPPRPTTSTN